MIPRQVKLNSSEQLGITWDDGHVSIILLKTLRDKCPCAGCQGETVLLRSYQPPVQPELPGKYKLKDAAQVGSYAIQLTWGDGHNTGLYTYEKLRSLCECERCLKGPA